MVKTNTQFKAIKSLISKSLAILALLLVTFGAEAQTYSNPTHYYGCSYTRFGRNYISYAAITTVVITDEAGNGVYSKANDNCNKNDMGGHFTVIEPTTAFDLSAGSKYTLTVGAYNPNGSRYAIELGAWIDFNSDKDFSDEGEFITPLSWYINPNGTRSLTFTVPCGGLNEYY
jgi:hypothetical protein